MNADKKKAGEVRFELAKPRLSEAREEGQTKSSLNNLIAS